MINQNKICDLFISSLKYSAYLATLLCLVIPLDLYACLCCESEFEVSQPGSTKSTDQLVLWDNIYADGIVGGKTFEFRYALAADRAFNEFIPNASEGPAIGNHRDNNAFVRVYRRKRGQAEWQDMGPALVRGKETMLSGGKAFESQAIWTMDVYQDRSTGRFQMLYTVRKRGNGRESLNQHIALADSVDGLHWNKRGVIIDAKMTAKSAGQKGDSLDPLTMSDGQIPALRDPKTIQIGLDRHIVIASKVKNQKGAVPGLAHFVMKGGQPSQLKQMPAIKVPMETYDQIEVPSLIKKNGSLFLILNASRLKKTELKPGEDAYERFVVAFKSTTGDLSGEWVPAGKNKTEIVIGPSSTYPVVVSQSISGKWIAAGNNYYQADARKALTEPVEVEVRGGEIKITFADNWVVRSN